nr:MAG TPA: Regulatory protein-modification, helix-turn-helix, transcriptional regulato, DNA [Caudoviricetes sp.]
MRKRCNKKIENVDFEKLRKCLKDHGIKQRELSIVCGYYPEYIEKNVLQRHFLNKHVSDVLTYVYKIEPSEYMDIQPKEVTNAEDDEMYTFTISCNGKFLKKLAIKSMEEHTTIEDFVFKCIIEGIGEKILEEDEK